MRALPPSEITPTTPFSLVLDAYGKAVTPTKRGRGVERSRLCILSRSFLGALQALVAPHREHAVADAPQAHLIVCALVPLPFHSSPTERHREGYFDGNGEWVGEC